MLALGGRSPTNRGAKSYTTFPTLLVCHTVQKLGCSAGVSCVVACKFIVMVCHAVPYVDSVLYTTMCRVVVYRTLHHLG